MIINVYLPRTGVPEEQVHPQPLEHSLAERAGAFVDLEPSAMAGMSLAHVHRVSMAFPEMTGAVVVIERFRPLHGALSPKTEGERLQMLGDALRGVVVQYIKMLPGQCVMVVEMGRSFLAYKKL